MASQNGSLTSHLGLNYDPIFPAAPTFSSPPAKAVVYSPTTKESFRFQGEALNTLQNHFLEKVVELAKDNGTQVIFLNFPLLKEAQNDEIIEKQCWPERFGGEVKLIGVKPTELFQGISEQGLNDLYYDPRHFNEHGQELYTRSILPALGEVYAK